jgi:predicted esterase
MLPVPLYRDLPRAGVHYPPIRALHGSDDEVVPTAGTIQMVNALHARGLDISLATFDGAEHEINRPMRAKMLADLREAISSERAAEPQAARP